MNTSLNHTRIGTDMDILHKTAKNIENRVFAMSRRQLIDRSWTDRMMCVVKAVVDQRMTARGTVMFLPSLAISWSPRVRSVSSQEYLSIRHTDSKGT